MAKPRFNNSEWCTGKDGNPLNEVELICDSLMNNDGLATLWALRTGFSLRDQDRHSRR